MHKGVRLWSVYSPIHLETKATVRPLFWILPSLDSRMPPSTCSETLISAVAGCDEQPALLVTEGGPVYSRKELRQEICRTAAKFPALGIKRGDVVAMSFDNDVELVICFIAVCHLGATAAPLNAKYKPDEVVFYLTDILCNLLVVPAGGNKDAEQAAASCNVLPSLV